MSTRTGKGFWGRSGAREGEVRRKRLEGGGVPPRSSRTSGGVAATGGLVGGGDKGVNSRYPGSISSETGDPDRGLGGLRWREGLPRERDRGGGDGEREGCSRRDREAAAVRDLEVFEEFFPPLAALVSAALDSVAYATQSPVSSTTAGLESAG